MNEMQYAAMAHSLSGQPLPDDYAAEYADLEQQINRLKSTGSHICQSDWGASSRAGTEVAEVCDGNSICRDSV